MWAQGCLQWCMAWWSLLKTLFCWGDGLGCFIYFLGKNAQNHFSCFLSLEGLQINRRRKEKETKIIVDFSCRKFQAIAMNLITPKSTCLLGLSSYVASSHWGKTRLRRILKWANAESRWQTLAAMISSLIICTACCGRRPARPANRRAQEGRESINSFTGSGPALREDANINRVYPLLISR